MLGFALATFLIMVFPALQLWKSLRKLSPPKPSRQSRYVRIVDYKLVAACATFFAGPMLSVRRDYFYATFVPGANA